ncbi:MAG TPA: YbaB/EbfC family nucleoid-associated protein [Mycobacteriales bacterium]|nr:YbaB/EbfC family nucleoid-associated protein [Mycobacteriales bacterium]
MSQTFQEQMEAALADLRGQQTRIQEASRQLAQITGKARSKDRAVEAVVDSQGKLTSLKLTGTAYRKLAPAELAARIVETVRTAQDAASQRAFESLGGLMPTGLGSALGAAAPAADGSWDIDAMFDAAARAVQEPLFTEGRTDDAS